MSFDTYFRLCSFATIAVATLALLLAGALHPALGLVFAALMIVAWRLEGSRWQVSERVALVLVLLALPVFYLDWVYLGSRLHLPGAGLNRGPALVSAIGHLVVFLSAIKLLQTKSDRDWVFLYLISFFQVLLAA